MLRESLAHLSAPAPAQLSYLRTQGPVPIDELALDFDAFGAAVRDSGWVSEEAAAAINKVDVQLKAMSGSSNAELWTEEALDRATEWDTVRDLARVALDL